MLGAILGDIVGSAYEFNPTNDYNFEMFKDGSKFTDDTICTVAIADAILKGRDYGESLHEWCRKYMGPKGGYGARFRQWVESDDPQPYGSYGNGSAMRVSPIGMWWAGKPFNLKREATKSAACTHNHPEGIRGAVAIAQAVGWAVETTEEYLTWRMSEELCDDFEKKLLEGNGYAPNPHYLDYKNDFDETCQKTIPPALDIIRNSRNFEDAIRLAVSLGADADTLGAIVGSIAEHLWGIPEWMKVKAMSYLTPEMRHVVEDFYEGLKHRDFRQYKDKVERAKKRREDEERRWMKACDRHMYSDGGISYMKCKVAGTRYCKDQSVFERMEDDDMLTLRHEYNEHDSNAVAIYFKDQCIGFVPRRQNQELAKLAKLGWGKMFLVFVDENCMEDGRRKVSIEIVQKHCEEHMPVDFDDTAEWWGSEMAEFIDEQPIYTDYDYWDLWTKVSRKYEGKCRFRFNRPIEQIAKMVDTCIEKLGERYSVSNCWDSECGVTRHVSFRRLKDRNWEEVNYDDESRRVIEAYNLLEDAQLYYSTGGRTGTVHGNVTRPHIDRLNENEVFVFGSNAQGHHIGGAARTAMEKFGAVWGEGDGLHGQSYAISTMEGLVNTARNINQFVEFATRHQELKFFVTPIGCGIAGYNPLQIAPLFRKAIALPNVYLPRIFWEYYWQTEEHHPEFFQPDKAWEKWVK